MQELPNTLGTRLCPPLVSLKAIAEQEMEACADGPEAAVSRMNQGLFWKLTFFLMSSRSTALVILSTQAAVSSSVEATPPLRM